MLMYHSKPQSFITTALSNQTNLLLNPARSSMILQSRTAPNAEKKCLSSISVVCTAMQNVVILVQLSDFSVHSCPSPQTCSHVVTSRYRNTDINLMRSYCIIFIYNNSANKRMEQQQPHLLLKAIFDFEVYLMVSKRTKSFFWGCNCAAAFIQDGWHCSGCHKTPSIQGAHHATSCWDNAAL